MPDQAHTSDEAIRRKLLAYLSVHWPHLRQRQPSPQLTRVVLAPPSRDTAPRTRLCEFH